jgi:beta-lactamase class A
MRKFAEFCVLFLLFPFAFTAKAQDRVQGPAIDLLKGQIQQIADGVRANWGIYIRSLTTGETVAIHADQPMETMSVIKVPILVTAFRQMDAGKFKLSDPIALTVAEKRFGTGVLQYLHDGLNLTVKDALTLMIIQSDNTATDMMYDKVGGPAAVTQTMRELGLKTITSRQTGFEWFRALAASTDPSYFNDSPAALFERGFPETPREDADFARFDADGKSPFGLASPHDIGDLLAKIVEGQAATRPSCDQMMAILRQQQMRTRIPKYIEDAADVGHKTGDFPPFIANDVGFVKTPRSTFVIAVFDDHYHGIYANLEDAVARIAQHAFLYFNYHTSGGGANPGR